MGLTLHGAPGPRLLPRSTDTLQAGVTSTPQLIHPRTQSRAWGTLPWPPNTQVPASCSQAAPKLVYLSGGQVPGPRPAQAPLTRARLNPPSQADETHLPQQDGLLPATQGRGWRIPIGLRRRPVWRCPHLRAPTRSTSWPWPGVRCCVPRHCCPAVPAAPPRITWLRAAWGHVPARPRSHVPQPTHPTRGTRDASEQWKRHGLLRSHPAAQPAEPRAAQRGTAAFCLVALSLPAAPTSTWPALRNST